jgi:hypothetical protein
MKTNEAFGLTFRVIGFAVGLILAIIGAYFFLSGLLILPSHGFLPGALDLLLGFVFIRASCYLIPVRKFKRGSQP